MQKCCLFNACSSFRVLQGLMQVFFFFLWSMSSVWMNTVGLILTMVKFLACWWTTYLVWVVIWLQCCITGLLTLVNQDDDIPALQVHSITSFSLSPFKILLLPTQKAKKKNCYNRISSIVLCVCACACMYVCIQHKTLKNPRKTLLPGIGLNAIPHIWFGFLFIMMEKNLGHLPFIMTPLFLLLMSVFFNPESLLLAAKKAVYGVNVDCLTTLDVPFEQNLHVIDTVKTSLRQTCVSAFRDANRP